MIKKLLLSFAAFCAVLGIGANAAENNTITDKVIAGYQAWFNTPDDGSPKNNWVHWGKPEPGKITFEAYPDVRDYDDASLKQTGFSALGNGDSAKLFSSYSDDVIDKHFKMMEDYGIDGAAVQKFGSCTAAGSEVNQQNHKALMKKIRSAAEKHDRLFYLMYDISGLSEENLISSLENDWQQVMIDELDITSSPSYARENGKPVVCIWGIGIRNGTPKQYCELIDWFHEKGCYVIGGVPKGWRTSMTEKEGMEEAYCRLDMISPWAVGSASTDAEVDFAAEEFLAKDKEYLDARNIAYQPVMYPGFAWSNWKDNPRNQIPRRAGDFLWRQAYNVAKLNIPCGYIAMFDEYDEGTAILKIAEDSSMIPKDQYFLTASADGRFTSSDLYLRIAGYIPKVLRGEKSLTEEMPLPLTVGPVHYRSSFEKYLDAVPGENIAVKDELSASGKSALKLEGSGNTEYYISDLDFNAVNNVHIGAAVYSAEGNAKIYADVVTDDGVYSCELPCGENAWNRISAEVNGTAGKKITGLKLRAESGGSYKVYVDDVTVSEDAEHIDTRDTGSKYDTYARSLYNLGLLEGESKEEYSMKLDAPVTREQAVKAVMTAAGKKSDSTEQAPFKDVSEWALPYVNEAYKLKIVKGVSDDSFNAQGVITKREAAAILLRALGYTENAYENFEEMSVKNGLFKDISLTADADKALTYDDLVFMMYRSMFMTPNDDDTILLNRLMNDGAFDGDKINSDISLADEYNASLKPPAKIEFGKKYFYNLMTIALNDNPDKGDSYTKSDEYDGVNCVYVPEGQFMYCQVSDVYISPSDKNVKITVTYLDNGMDRFGIHYNSCDESLNGNAANYKECSFEKGTNSGTWQTQTIILNDAAFNNKQNNGADFRVFGSNLRIKDISVEKIEN